MFNFQWKVRAQSSFRIEGTHAVRGNAIWKTTTSSSWYDNTRTHWKKFRHGVKLENSYTLTAPHVKCTSEWFKWVGVHWIRTTPKTVNEVAIHSVRCKGRERKKKGKVLYIQFECRNALAVCIQNSVEPGIAAETDIKIAKLVVVSFEPLLSTSIFATVLNWTNSEEEENPLLWLLSRYILYQFPFHQLLAVLKWNELSMVHDLPFEPLGWILCDGMMPFKIRKKPSNIWRVRKGEEKKKDLR